MKTFYVLCSIPAAVAFWFGAQAGTEAFVDPQEPAAAEPAFSEVQDVIVVTQEEGQAPRAVTGAVMPRRAIRTEVRSTGSGEPATFTFQGPVTATVPAVPTVPGVAALPTEHGVLAVTAHQGAHVVGGHAVVFDDETRKAMQKLKKAESDEDREEAREELRDALNEQYDKYLARQAKELKRMEEKLDELKSQLEKRRDAKEELVDLRLKTLENDANGLAWPGGEHGPDQMIWRSVAPVPPVAPVAPPGGVGSISSEGVRFFGHAGELKGLRTRIAGDGESRSIFIERSDAEPEADDAAAAVDAAAAADEAEEADADDSDDDADDKSRSRIRRRNK